MTLSYGEANARARVNSAAFQSCGATGGRVSLYPHYENSLLKRELRIAGLDAGFTL